MADITRRALIVTAAGASLATQVSAQVHRATGSVQAKQLYSGRFADVTGLNDLQAGHLRHFRNLAAQDAGDWTDMQRGSGSFGGELRFNLAIMSYALSLTHYHHLPAAPALFKNTFDSIITKMQHHDVWGYWLGFSPSNPIADPTLKSPRPYDWNPVSNENIMYSGHLNAMVGLYSWLFQDDKYDRVGSISFSSEPGRFYGRVLSDPTMGAGAHTLDKEWLRQNTANYNLQSLNDVIYWQMVANGFMGVACEPNQVFVVCNQFPMLGFRFQDLRKGTSVADEIARSYKTAWTRRGFLMPDGKEVHRQWKKSVDTIAGPSSPWTYAFLNAVNRDVVQQTYPNVREAMGKRNDDGTFVGYPARQWAAVRAQRATGAPLPQPVPDHDGFAIGSAALLFSEMGDPEIAALYAYADKYLSPTWKNGGLYYPRNSQIYDHAGNPTAVGSGVGNAFLGYGRLNVKDGLHTLYNSPWDKQVFDQPKVTEIDDVDVLRARFLPDRNTLVLTVRPYPGSPAKVSEMVIANAVRPGDWVLKINGEEMASGRGNSVTKTRLGQAAFEGQALRITVPIEPAADMRLAWT